MRNALKKWICFAAAAASLFLFATSASATGGAAGVIAYVIVIAIVGGSFGVVLTCFGFHGLLAYSLGALMGLSGGMFGIFMEDRLFPIFDLREKPPSSSSSKNALPIDPKMNVS